MRETLFLRLRDLNPEAGVAYITAVAESPSGMVARTAPLAQVAGLTAGRRVVAFVPAQDVRLTRVSLPVRQAAKALQATPYLIEEQFAEDVEELQFALGPRQADGSFPVAAVARGRLDAWLAPLKEAGIEAHALVPEMLALPWPEEAADGPWSALAEEDRVTVRTGPWSGFCAEPDELETLLQLADAGAAEAHALRLLVTQAVSRDYSALPRKVDLLPGFSHPLEAFARHYRAQASINLLQGPYARRESWRRHWQPWQLAAGLAAGLFIGSVLLNGVRAYQLNHVAAAQEQANAQRFTQLFPTERPSPYLSAQIDSLVRRAQGGNGGSLFFLLQEYAKAQSAATGLTLKGLQFHDGALYLDLTGNDLQQLEHLRDWFSSHPGVHLEVPNADSTSSGVQIRLKLSPA